MEGLNIRQNKKSFRFKRLLPVIVAVFMVSSLITYIFFHEQNIRRGFSRETNEKRDGLTALQLSMEEDDDNGRNETVPSNSSLFIRGDCNGDGTVNANDLLYLVNYLYYDGSEPVGLDNQPNLNSGDTNDDNIVTSADEIFLVFWLYYKGWILPPPYPGPGYDPTPPSS